MKQKAKAIINKSGKGYISVRLPLTQELANELGINKEDRDFYIEKVDNKIIITKGV